MNTPITLTLGQIAEHVSGRLLDPCTADLPITRARGLSEAESGDLSFVEAARHLDAAVASTQALALLVPAATDACAVPAVAVRSPRLAFARVLALLHPRHRPSPGVHHTAAVDASAHIDETAHIGPYCSIGSGVRVGAGAVLHPHVKIGAGATIGDDTELRPRVNIGPDVTVGTRCLIHAGTTIGVTRDGRRGLAGVMVGDDVEMGSRAVVEAGTTSPTRVESGCRTDNLIYIGAGAHLGPHCLMVSYTHVGSEAVLAHHVTLAGQAMVTPRARVDAIAVVGARGKVLEHVAERTVVSGDPAIPHKEELRRAASAARLGQLATQLETTLSRVSEDQ